MSFRDKHMLETLRRAPDTIHIEPVSEELHWLATYSLPGGNRGLTDCCLVEHPCPYHLAIYNGRCPAPWVPHLTEVQHWPGVRASFHGGTR